MRSFIAIIPDFWIIWKLIGIGVSTFCLGFAGFGSLSEKLCGTHDIAGVNTVGRWFVISL